MSEQYIFDFTHSGPLVSSWLDRAYYNVETQDLAVTVNDGDYIKTYGYQDVPVDVYTDFFLTTSAGNYYNTNVKGVFHGINHDPDAVWVMRDVSESFDYDSVDETVDETVKTTVYSWAVDVQIGDGEGDVITVIVDAPTIAEAVAKAEALRPRVVGVCLD